MYKLILAIFFCLVLFSSSQENKAHFNIVNYNNELPRILNCKLINNDTLVRLYKNVVFNNANCGVYDPVIAKQWNSTIKVYIDKSLPKKDRKAFIKFYKQLNVLEHLKIEFVKDIEKSNYLITSTKEDLLTKTGLTDKDETYIYSHVDYSAFNDANSKFYGCKMEININAIIDKTLIIKKLKQLFFISLGQFVGDKSIKSNSLISYNYANNEQISQSDLQLLQLHYLQLHNKPISCSSFSKIIDNLKLQCNDD